MTALSEKTFEDKLAQMCRLYRGLAELWKTVDASNKEEVARWVKAGGLMIEMLDEAMAMVEDHAGAADLRIILDQMAAIRANREAAKDKA